jgi:hypothetical protein
VSARVFLTDGADQAPAVLLAMGARGWLVLRYAADGIGTMVELVDPERVTLGRDWLDPWIDGVDPAGAELVDEQHGARP